MGSMSTARKVNSPRPILSGTFTLADSIINTSLIITNSTFSLHTVGYKQFRDEYIKIIYS